MMYIDVENLINMLRTLVVYCVYLTKVNQTQTEVL